MRERGLKYRCTGTSPYGRRSLPVRERGLKCLGDVFPFGQVGSLPVRERGLKSYRMVTPLSPPRVAPCAGAWVEIIQQQFAGDEEAVAPCAGAWVEIAMNTSLTSTPPRSLPVRERGLKFPGLFPCCQSLRSLPVRERGLKYCFHVSFLLLKSRSLCGSVG